MNMNIAYKNIEKGLYEFRKSKNEYKEFQEQNEVLMISRVVKKEILDMADTIDLLAHVINKQDEILNQINSYFFHLDKANNNDF